MPSAEGGRCICQERIRCKAGAERAGNPPGARCRAQRLRSLTESLTRGRGHFGMQKSRLFSGFLCAIGAPASRLAAQGLGCLGRLLQQPSGDTFPGPLWPFFCCTEDKEPTSATSPEPFEQPDPAQGHNRMLELLLQVLELLAHSHLSNLQGTTVQRLLPFKPYRCSPAALRSRQVRAAQQSPEIFSLFQLLRRRFGLPSCTRLAGSELLQRWFRFRCASQVSL